jgi:hypothetical protein
MHITPLSTQKRKHVGSTHVNVLHQPGSQGDPAVREFYPHSDKPHEPGSLSIDDLGGRESFVSPVRQISVGL